MYGHLQAPASLSAYPSDRKWTQTWAILEYVEKKSSYLCREQKPDTSAVQPIPLLTQPVRLSFCNIVACRAVSRRRLGKHIPVATDTHATTDVMLEMVFSIQSVQRGYKEVKWMKNISVGKEPPFRKYLSMEAEE
jgi:hypothetical protein